MTGLALVLFGAPEASSQEVDASAPDTATAAPAPPALGIADSARADSAVDVGRSVEEATTSAREFANEAVGVLPKILFTLGIFLVAALLVRLLRAVLRTVLRQWEHADAATSMSAVVIWLIAIGASLTVISGDTRALLGSVGLLGLALSWALQAPIESFAGWLLNSFKGYYRVGDRIEVGDVFGDVYRIDALTTTVWEAGGPEKSVQGAQPTGALITFPNSEVLRANIVNFTRLFPYVWDEVTVGVANESDLQYAIETIRAVATRVVGPAMAEPVATYRGLLRRERLDYDIDDVPQVYISLTESWTNVTVRYLVGARERRRWASTLMLAIQQELAEPRHEDRIFMAYPVQRVDAEVHRSEERPA